MFKNWTKCRFNKFSYKLDLNLPWIISITFFCWILINWLNLKMKFSDLNLNFNYFKIKSGFIRQKKNKFCFTIKKVHVFRNTFEQISLKLFLLLWAIGLNIPFSLNMFVVYACTVEKYKIKSNLKITNRMTYGLFFFELSITAVYNEFICSLYSSKHSSFKKRALIECNNEFSNNFIGYE